MLSRSSDGSLNEEADVFPAVMASTESSGGGGGGIELMVNKPFSKQIGSLLTAVLNAQSNSQLSLRARVRRRTDRLHRPPPRKNDTLPRKCDSAQSFKPEGDGNKSHLFTKLSKQIETFV